MNKYVQLSKKINNRFWISATNYRFLKWLSVNRLSFHITTLNTTWVYRPYLCNNIYPACVHYISRFRCGYYTWNCSFVNFHSSSPSILEILAAIYCISQTVAAHMYVERMPTLVMSTGLYYDSWIVDKSNVDYHAVCSNVSSEARHPVSDKSTRHRWADRSDIVDRQRVEYTTTTNCQTWHCFSWRVCEPCWGGSNKCSLFRHTFIVTWMNNITDVHSAVEKGLVWGNVRKEGIVFWWVSK